MTQNITENTKNRLNYYGELLVNSPYVIFILCGYLLVNLGGFPLFDLDEGAFSSATMEMLQRGDFITTYMGGELRFDKPILIYWLQSLSVYLLGLNEFSLRLPSALCSMLWLMCVYVFTKNILNTSKANTAIILMSTSLIFSVIARAATADALLNLFICLSLIDSFKCITSPQNNTKLRLLPYIWIGLGILAKGPIAIFIPLVSITLFSALTKNWKKYIYLIINPLGWIICCSIFLPWYIAEYNAQGQAFIEGFFLKHNLNRFSSTMEGHGGHWYYYLLISLILFMPATGLFIRLLREINVKNMPLLDIWGWCWFLTVLVFFSFSNTQLSHYLLYGATPIFILLAQYRDRIKTQWSIILPSATLIILFILTPTLIQQNLDSIKNPSTQKMLADGILYFDTHYKITTLLALFIVLIIGLQKSLLLWQRQLWISITTSILFIHTIIPTFAAIQQQPVVNAAGFAASLNTPIVMYQHDMPSLSIYMNKVIPIRPPVNGEVLFTDINHLHQYKNYTLLFSQGGIALARINLIE